MRAAIALFVAASMVMVGVAGCSEEEKPAGPMGGAGAGGEPVDAAADVVTDVIETDVLEDAEADAETDAAEEEDAEADAEAGDE